MKRTAAILMLITILYSSGGYFLLMQLAQERVREMMEKEIISGMDNQILSAFTSREESKTKWLRKDKEFEYQGVLYDVARIIWENGRQVYLCIADIKEKEIVTSIEKFGRPDGDNDLTKRLTSQMIQLLYLPSSALEGHFAFSLNIAYPFLCLYDPSCEQQVPSPPPKIHP